MKTNKVIKFDEEFEFNFLFSRTQYLRLQINSSDGKFSEITINLAKVMTSKLADLVFPVNLIKQENVDFTGNKFNKHTQNIELKFKRITQFLDKVIPTIYLEFQFIFASQV